MIPDRDTRFNGARDGALGAFWATVSGAYPEVVTGDMSPEALEALEAAAAAAIRAWLDANRPARPEPFLSADTLAEMRAWLADCSWRDLEPDDIRELEAPAIVDAIRRHYHGGIAGFMEAIG